MLTVETIKSASQGTNYYMGAAYYSLDKTEKMQHANWYGKGAKDLDLLDEIEKEKLSEILNGIIKDNKNNIQLGRKNRDGSISHDCGRDLTFAVPKSVSLQHNLEGGDSRIKEAIFTAVKNTLDYVEKDFVNTRITKNKERKFEKTSNMVAAIFYENLNRDYEFHDHVHCVIANMTKSNDNKWRSIEFKKIFEKRIHIGKVFRMELSYELRKLGYNIEMTDKEQHFFEIKNYDSKLANHFSQRTQNIVEKAKDISPKINSSVKQLANLLTRNNNKNITQSELVELTNLRIAEYESSFPTRNVKKDINTLTKTALKNTDDATEKVYTYTKGIVGNSIEHLAERNTLLLEREIIDKSILIGVTNLKAITKEINRLKKKDILIKGVKEISNKNLGEETNYCTTNSLTREKAIISFLHEGKKQFKNIITKKEANLLLKDTALNKGQKEAAKLVFTSKDSIAIIQGYAGTGKTFMLSVLKEKLDHINNALPKKDKINQDFKIIGLAPSGAAARELQEVLGDKNAYTLQSFLSKYAGYAEGRGTIEGKEAESLKYVNHTIVIDEASMMSSKLMQDYFAVAKALKLKTILIGDNHQLLGVEEGNPFYQMQKEKVEMITMDQIVRQKTQIGKAISYSAYASDIHKVFSKIGNNIIDCNELLKAERLPDINANNKYTALTTARLYTSFTRAEREETVVLAQANKSKNLVNQYIRRILKDRNELEKEAAVIDVLVNANLTISERGLAKSYSLNQRILFNKKNEYCHINKNEYFKIKEIDINSNLLTLISLENSNKIINFNPLTSKSFRKHIEVYNKESRELNANDKMMFTRKYATKEKTFVNSSCFTINKIQDKKVSFQLDGKIFEIAQDNPSLQHIDYSYCRTTHKGQGLTAKNSILLSESWWDFLNSKRNLLVQVTRQKENIYLVLNDREKLIKKILNHEEDNRSSLEFAASNNHNVNQIIDIEKKDYKYLGGNIEYQKYNIAKEESKNFEKYSKSEKNNFTGKQIDSSLTNSENINSTISAIERISSQKDNIIKIIEGDLRKESIRVSNTKNNIKEDFAAQKQNNNIENKKYKDNRSPSQKIERNVKFITEFSEVEVKQYFKEFIQENINNHDFKNLDYAIDKAFSELGRAAYFGEKQKGVVCWYGEAGYVKHYKINDGDVFKWGKGKIKTHEYSNSRRKKITIEELNIRQKEQELKQKNLQIQRDKEYQDKAKKAEFIFKNIPHNYRNLYGKKHSYLAKKGIAGAYRLQEINFKRFDLVDQKTGEKNINYQLIIPLKNIKGDIKSFQYINSFNNSKGFMKGGQKLGNFNILGENYINKSNKIYFAEGFATAASIYAATKCPVVICFDASNILHVVKEIKNKFPNKDLIIAADNDKHSKNGINTGLDAAQLAADKYGAHVVLPEFNKHDIAIFHSNAKSTKMPKDFNDFHQIHGLTKTRNTLLSYEKNIKAISNDNNISHTLKTIDFSK